VGGGGGPTSGPKTRHFVFGYVTSGPSTRPFFLGGGRSKTEVDQKQDFFVFGYITNGPETRLFVFGGARGQKQDFGDNWIPETLGCRWHLDGLFLQRYGGMCTCTQLELQVQQEFFSITVAGRIDGL